MLSKLLEYFNQNGLAIILVFLLWFIVFNEKAMERARKGKTKIALYIAIIMFYLATISEIIFQIIIPILSKG